MARYVTRGRDSSGRPIRMTPLFDEWWDAYCTRLGFTPTITQGGWQGGTGASASAGTHEGDALDLRVWDRSVTQVQAMVRVAREMGAAAWLRDRHHGGFSDPHVHLIPGPWATPAPAAIRQWDAYLRGRDGLASNGPDYHPRPAPLVTRWEPDDMSQYAKQLDAIQNAVDALTKQQKKRADRTLAFQRYVRAALGKAAGVDKQVLADLDRLIAEAESE